MIPGRDERGAEVDGSVRGTWKGGDLEGRGPGGEGSWKRGELEGRVGKGSCQLEGRGAGREDKWTEMNKQEGR